MRGRECNRCATRCALEHIATTANALGRAVGFGPDAGGTISAYIYPRGYDFIGATHSERAAFWVHTFTVIPDECIKRFTNATRNA